MSPDESKKWAEALNHVVRKVEARTQYQKASTRDLTAAELQAHNNAVRYRNIWVRKL